ncbi:MAG TPA: hypothetical protein VLF89_09610 [Candidatus Saccharimonadales bacterium]|nr:hypothetical protein [Candidatus Saccharimonadales bacterium]
MHEKKGSYSRSLPTDRETVAIPEQTVAARKTFREDWYTKQSTRTQHSISKVPGLRNSSLYLSKGVARSELRDDLERHFFESQPTEKIAVPGGVFVDEMGGSTIPVETVSDIVDEPTIHLPIMINKKE